MGSVSVCLLAVVGLVHWAHLPQVSANIGSELLQNADFEGDFSENWYCDSGCTLTPVDSDALNGQRAAKVTGRSRRTSCLRQDVTVSGVKRYYFSAWVKFLNCVDCAGGDRLDAYVVIHTTSGSSSTKRFAKTNYILPSTGYAEVAGDFITPSDVNKLTLMVLNSKTPLNYLVDKASLTEIPIDPNWEAAADARIRDIRRGDINLQYNIGSQYDLSKVKVLLDQRSHDFMFGMSVTAWRMSATDEINRRYQNFVYSISNTATITNAEKYRFMEQTESNPTFSTIDNALNAMNAHNISHRFHCVAWNKLDRIVSWLKAKSADETYDHVYRRVAYLKEHYPNMFRQIDCNNEALHGDYYERKTGDHEFTNDLIREIDSAFPNADLCLNDYNVVSSGMFTGAYRFQAETMIKKGVPIDCLGVQSHFATQPEPDAMKKRLDVLASVGKKIMVTELDIYQTDLALRAKGYKDAMRMFFSHPAVVGIVLWAPWNRDNGGLPTAIVEGDNLQDNESGQIVRNFIKNEWWTNENMTPSSRTGTDTVKGYYGKFDYTVTYDGQTKSTGSLYLSQGNTVNLPVNLS